MNRANEVSPAAFRRLRFVRRAAFHRRRSAGGRSAERSGAIDRGGAESGGAAGVARPARPNGVPIPS